MNSSDLVFIPDTAAVTGGGGGGVRIWIRIQSSFRVSAGTEPPQWIWTEAQRPEP